MLLLDAGDAINAPPEDGPLTAPASAEGVGHHHAPAQSPDDRLLWQLPRVSTLHLGLAS